MPERKRDDMADVSGAETADVNGDGTRGGMRDESRSRPPAETLRAIEEQTTPELWQQARRHAERRVKRLRKAGIPVSARSGAELVADAYADTWSGKTLWTPAKCSLLTHLRSAIKKRVYRETRRASRFQTISMPQRGAANDEVLLDIERALRDAAREYCPVTLSRIITTIYQNLHRLIAHDKAAIAVLRCWEDGITERVEIIERTGLADERAYYRARKQLIRASRALPSDVREAAQDFLRNVS